MNIEGKTTVVTGAASGIGRAVAVELANRKAKTVALVDMDEGVRETSAIINEESEGQVAYPFIGDVTDPEFRRGVYKEVTAKNGIVHICIPAAGITRDRLSVKIDKESGAPDIYPLETFRLVTEVDLIAPIYWAFEMVAILAEDRKRRGLKQWAPEEGVQGNVVFIGSVSSLGNKGQISYSAAKAGLEGAAATLMQEAIFHGVRCGVIHPGYTDTPMVRSLGEEYISTKILPHTQLRRLIRPEEIAGAICFMVENSAVSGQLWADAGWSPAA